MQIVKGFIEKIIVYKYLSLSLLANIIAQSLLRLSVKFLLSLSTSAQHFSWLNTESLSKLYNNKMLLTRFHLQTSEYQIQAFLVVRD